MHDAISKERNKPELCLAESGGYAIRRVVPRVVVQVNEAFGFSGEDRRENFFGSCRYEKWGS